MELRRAAPIDTRPLVAVERRDPEPAAGEVRLRVRCCGVCRTDLHIAEGEIDLHLQPVILGHQAVGEVDALGPGAEPWRIGDLAGVVWLHHACGHCEFCQRGEENLCPRASFTGYDVDGGFAEACLARADFAVPISAGADPLHVAPLLCAGMIGYRSLRRADVAPGERLGLVGFGASAHLALQVACYWQCRVAVFSRGERHRRLALELGAAWAGEIDEAPPWPLDRAVLFAPAGPLLPKTLEKLRPGGTLAINAIHLTPIPSFPYRLLYGERTVRSVANLTRRDASEFLDLALRIPVHTHVQAYPLGEANRALLDMKDSRLEAAAVLQV